MAPELNPLLNLQRSITAVWQEYRGLGLLDGQSHAANLIDAFFIFCISFVLPKTIIRFFVILLLHCLIQGSQNWTRNTRQLKESLMAS